METKTKKKHLIQEIIKLKHDEEKQYLRLVSENKFWLDVLLARDWSILKELWLGNLWKIRDMCEITDETINIFLKINWSHLECLYLSRNNLTSKGIHTILNYSLPLHIKVLKLNNNPIGNMGMKYLIKMDLPILEILSVYGCPIQNEGFKHLTKGRWPNITIIELGCFSKYVINDWPTPTNKMPICSLILTNWLVELGFAPGCKNPFKLYFDSKLELRKERLKNRNL